MLSARTVDSRSVNFPGDESLVNRMVRVKITDVYPHTLGGELVNE